MPRLSDVVDDTTPINASRINVPARIGWLMRVSRTTAGVSLREMSARLRERDVRLSPTTLSRIEGEGHRSSAALDGYTAALGLTDGLLRAGVDLLYRCFPYAPVAPPEPRAPSVDRFRLDRFSEAVDAVGEAGTTGGDWLRFARLHAADNGFGLTRSQIEPHVRRLADTMLRSMGPGFLTRYEALSQLRCSAYAEVVDDALRELILEPDNQLPGNLASALSELPTAELMRWAGGLLDHESLLVAQGSSHALQNMLVVGGLGLRDWEALVPDIERAWLHTSDDPQRHTLLVQLCGALPTSLQKQVRDVVPLPDAPTWGPVGWARTRGNAHYEFVRSIASAACAQLGHHDEPLLERLLFEAMFDPRGVRMSTASDTLLASPFAGALVPLLADGHDRGPDEATSLAALRVSAYCHAGEEVAIAGAWLDAGSRAEADYALRVTGRAGRRLSDTVLARGLAGDETSVQRTLYAAGMAADPRLHDLARRVDFPDPVRRAARWWAAREGRVLDPVGTEQERGWLPHPR